MSNRNNINYVKFALDCAHNNNYDAAYGWLSFLSSRATYEYASRAYRLVGIVRDNLENCARFRTFVVNESIARFLAESRAGYCGWCGVKRTGGPWNDACCDDCVISMFIFG